MIPKDRLQKPKSKLSRGKSKASLLAAAQLFEVSNQSLDSDNIYSKELEFFNFEGKWVFEDSIYNAAEKSDAIVILTEWEQYKKIDWAYISKKMRKPSWIFDVRSILDPKDIIPHGLRFWRIGDGSNNH